MPKLLLLVVLLPGLAIAEDAQILGGNVSCSTWIEGYNRYGMASSPEVSKELVNFARQRNWLLGFYSGANMRLRAAEGAAVVVPDEKGYLSLINQMCRNDPVDSLAGAAYRAFVFLTVNSPAKK